MGKRMRSDKGMASAEIVVMIPVIFLLFAVFFDPIIQEIQITSGEQVKNYYMGRVRVEGYLTAEDRSDMVEDFSKYGLIVQKIEAPSSPVYRDGQDGNQVYLAVEVKSTIKNMVPAFLNRGEYNTMVFKGFSLSEKLAE